MAKKEFKIVNKLGLHARAAALLVQLAGTFAAEITISKAGLEINGKSIMGVLMLAAAQHTVIVVEVVGEDETAALAPPFPPLALIFPATSTILPSHRTVPPLPPPPPPFPAFLLVPYPSSPSPPFT